MMQSDRMSNAQQPGVDLDLDIVVIGAGISGVSMGYYIQKHLPNKKYLILDSRERIGGTWDLFQYPGIRSDSDMYTFGYAFHPWMRQESISEGSKIVEYIQSAVTEYKIDENISFQQFVKTASWSSEQSKWKLEVYDAKHSRMTTYTTQFLLLCTGYYDHQQGYDPDFTGKETFKGLIVHPQKWPKDLNYENKTIVIIGSGATAVTLLPNLATTAKHVTMLQRSPTYISSVPSERSKYETLLYRILPQKWAFGVIRWYRILSGMWNYYLSRKFPKETVLAIKKGIRHFLGEEFDVDKHFTPKYDPWDQRFCVCPDGDFFRAIAQKKASVVTDTIEKFTENGVKISSGEILPADIIITATGLNLKPLGGIQFTVDSKPIQISETRIYKGVMLSSLPNLSWTVGYTNASFTLKSDLTSQHVCRLIKYMDSHHYSSCTPTLPPSSGEGQNMLNLTSNYITRSKDMWPKQGTFPWVASSNYLKDFWILKFHPINDTALQFK